MRALALLIGNAAYSKRKKLFNAANDATDFSNALSKIGFVVKPVIDAGIDEMDAEVASFRAELDNYDIGLFFYAGHGFQHNGENFLTATDTLFTAESIIRGSLNLRVVLDAMEDAKNAMNIIILDCCREDLAILGKKRSLSTEAMAPIFAPKGTIIAYSTSPGQTADDGLKTDRNGVYTRALLAHVVNQGISIEDFFKNVRNSVSLFTNEEQITWEHTSLTAPFILNSGSYIQASSSKYATFAVADAQYDGGGDSKLTSIIEDLKSHNFYDQGPAVRRFKQMTGASLDSDLLFIIGRNILQAAVGGEFESIKFIENLESRVLPFQKKNGNPVLEGIVFEMYFDQNGLFREDRKGLIYLSYVDAIKADKRFAKSFDFIRDELMPFKPKLFFIPTADETGKSIDVFLEKMEYKLSWREDDERIEIVYIVKSISFEGQIIMKDGEKDQSRFIHREDLTFSRFKLKVAELLGIPPKSLVVHTNIHLTDEDPVQFQWGVKLRKL
ncbi:caspase family protein [Mucilaginibacter flavus]|uniref:caspase family protein n=1 Tax=Mucilaginibacter flavus TaxID=931504 RepID=UPI0025B28EBF|nr:caspase family protein [Mucilaginibacter flavus]MDN3582106.1 caspase family protein [Mucilaginibacter flavus]